jgi:hypothetical protein
LDLFRILLNLLHETRFSIRKGLKSFKCVLNNM